MLIAAGPLAEAQDSCARLSVVERAQLGRPKALKMGGSSRLRHPTAAEWPAVRAWLVARASRVNSRLNEDLTAYTPGETMGLLNDPRVRAWHEEFSRFVVPARFTKIVFVPCAKTKPWSAAATGRSILYRGYHRVRREGPPDVYFVTLSEPLGIVPEARWDDFPCYDNPGLFKDDAQRSGVTRAEWESGPFGEVLITPFDEAAYAAAIARLAVVIRSFVINNATPGRQFYSFVDVPRGQSTHAEMLTLALGELPWLTVERSPKRPAPRASPCGLILTKIGAGPT